MSNIPRFAAYAAAFEKAYESDDWEEVGSFFSDDAVYEVGIDLSLGTRFAGRRPDLEREGSHHTDR